MTAQLLVGGRDVYRGGMGPSHAVWFFEGSRPAWILERTRGPVAGEEANSPEKPILWIPADPDHLIEDGVLLVALHVMRDPALHDAAGALLPELTRDGVAFKGASEERLAEMRDTYSQYVELEHLSSDALTELREMCAKIDWTDERCEKLILILFAGSSLRRGLVALERYPVMMEVCTPSYEKSRDWGGGPLRVRGSLERDRLEMDEWSRGR